MARRTIKSLTRAMARLLSGLVFALSACGLSLAATSGAKETPGGLNINSDDLNLLLVLFCLLTLALIFWMLWDRRRLRHRLFRKDQDFQFQSLLLASRDDVSLVWDERGQITSIEAVKQWFGLKTPDNSLACLKDADVGLSGDQFALLAESVERLLAYGEGFRRVFFLDSLKRHIVIKGAPLSDGRHIRGSIAWFRDATIEEHIAAFQDKEVRRIGNRLELLETMNNLYRFPIWMRDEDLNLIWVNDAYVAAVDGENAEQVIADGLELATSSIGKNVRDIAAISKQNRERYKEKHFVVIRGERRAVDIHNIPVDMGEKYSGCLGYALDITEQEKAKGELIHYTESHSETLNKLSTAVAIFTAGKRLDYYNRAFSRLWQLEESLLFSHPHHGELLEAMREVRRLPEQANFPQWKAEQLNAYTQLLEPVEEMWHLPDNTTLRVVTQPHPMGGLLIFYEDVTDHYVLERSYNTLFAVQRETLNNLHEGVAVFGIDGCLQLYNQAFAEIWRMEREMLDANPHIMEVMKGFGKTFDRRADLSDLKDMVVGGEMKKEPVAGQLRRRNDSVLNYAAVPLPDGAMLITFIDVSDSYAIERALRERNLALEETDKVKTEFLAHMSYELRNPLNSIIGFAELMEKEYQGPLNDVQHEYMFNILSASEQLLALINDILDLAVIEAGGMSLDIDQFDLPDMVRQVTDQLDERIKAKNLEVNVKCPAGLSPVHGDVKRIHHAVYNLLSNAVKFTPSLGIISLKVEQDDLNYRIIVQDSGVGIKSDEVGRIFEKFFTGSNVPNGQGAGLGLSLVKSFVELHGGKIDVRSTMNAGTTITVVLPLRLALDAKISLVGE